MHGGIIYIRGDFSQNNLGIGTVKADLNERDMQELKPLVSEFCSIFCIDEEFIWNTPFSKITPQSHRPYGAYYTSKPI